MCWTGWPSTGLPSCSGMLVYLPGVRNLTPQLAAGTTGLPLHGIKALRKPGSWSRSRLLSDNAIVCGWNPDVGARRMVC